MVYICASSMITLIVIKRLKLSRMLAQDASVLSFQAMTGHDLFGAARLDLVGLQVKHGAVSRTDNGIKIDLWLGSERFDTTNFTIPEKDD